MSTRTNVVFLDEKSDVKVFVYKHHDGYPSNIEPQLIKMVDKYNEGEKQNYLDILKEIDNEYEETGGIHGDVDYIYYIGYKPFTNKLKYIGYL